VNKGDTLRALSIFTTYFESILKGTKDSMLSIKNVFKLRRKKEVPEVIYVFEINSFY
jgi:hypothetical protein